MKRRLVSITIVILGLLIGTLTNVATGELPPEWKPYLWLSWVPLGVCVIAVIVLEWCASKEETASGGDTIYGDKFGSNKVEGDNVLGNKTVINYNPALTDQQRRNREVMLNKVESFWIKGVLDQSLYRIARIELGLEQAPERVEHPWDSLIQRAQQSPAPLPPGKPTIELFDEFHGALLILGAPGGGKTTVLLELTRDLIARARSDEQLSIPVVFNLSSWATKRQPLVEWLVEELNQRYDAPKGVAKEWVNTNALLLLLDGLDEVAAEHREACAEAINIFRKERGFVSLAVCCRVEEYTALSGKLRMEGAIVIQPLTRQKVEKYLKDVGRPLASVRAALRDDPSLWELLDSPLLLSITALAYKDKSVAKLRASGTLEERRHQLFDDYIAVMFTRPGRSKEGLIYPQEQTTHYLSWLARKLVEYNQTTYLIERMRPSWLPQRQRLQFVIQVTLIIWLVLGLYSTLVSGLFLILVFGLFSALTTGLAFGSFLGLIVGLGFGPFLGSFEEKNVERIEGLIEKLIGRQNFVLTKRKVERRVLTQSTEIITKDILLWSWRKIKANWKLMLSIDLLVGLATGLVFAPIFGLISALVLGLISMLIVGLLEMGVLISIKGMHALITINQLLQSSTFNEFTKYSKANRIRVMLLLGLTLLLNLVLIGGLTGLLITRLVGTQNLLATLGMIGLFSATIASFIVIVFVGSMIVGSIVLQRYVLRYFLYRNGFLPFRNLVPFLDYCVDRIFLLRVGGGYIFVHRLLMEHFASLYKGDDAKETAS